jgi:RNA polymerase sigma-70 factor, ECF subfamily
MVSEGTSDITQMLRRIRLGDLSAETELFPAVHSELRRLARSYLRRERPGHTLQPTALVNEAYIKLVGLRNAEYKDRSHFFAIAAKIMRHILTDHARRRSSAKRGGSLIPVSLEGSASFGDQDDEMILDLDLALVRLADFAPRQARVVEMRFFGGMSEDEIAETLSLSSRTIKRDWLVAKAWLYGELSPK